MLQLRKLNISFFFLVCSLFFLFCVLSIFFCVTVIIVSVFVSDVGSLYPPNLEPQFDKFLLRRPATFGTWQIASPHCG